LVSLKFDPYALTAEALVRRRSCGFSALINSRDMTAARNGLAAAYEFAANSIIDNHGPNAAVAAGSPIHSCIFLTALKNPLVFWRTSG
jgi:hypothetical protein